MEDNLINLIETYINEDLIDMILSNGPANFQVSKVKIRPILLKGTLVFQSSSYKGNQIFHQNHSKEELLKECEELLTDCMKQMLIKTKSEDIHVLISKKGKVTIKRKASKADLTKVSSNLSHNREKAYIIQEGLSVPFLVDLGVMTKEGKIVKTKYDKFKQINRFLEFIQDVLPSLNKSEENTIIDFGCGKSYLTFAMYYYLNIVKGYPIKVIGLDLKKDVINHCNHLAKTYGYDKLFFLEGDIASYDGVTNVDMVVSLHACDTATDYALYKGVEWGAKVILSVPCCQHEVNKQIQNDTLNPVLSYGLLKERMAALFTDGMRATLLETVGYHTQILEFIDMEHTPKNILIRAVKNKNTNYKEKAEKIKADYINLSKFINGGPLLYNLLYQSESNQEEIC